jgi:hypothetical protein
VIRLALLLLLLIPCLAWGTSYNVPGDFASLLDARNGSSAGDTLWLATPDSSYAADSLFVGSRHWIAEERTRIVNANSARAAIVMQLGAAGSASFTGIDFRTTKTGDGNCSAVYWDASGAAGPEATFTDCGFLDCDLRSGGATSAGAVYVHNGGSVTFSGCVFDSCSNDAKTAALYVDGSNVTAEDSIFRNNDASGTGTNAGGAVRWAAILGQDATFTNCLFVDNSIADQGAAIYIYAGFTGEDVLIDHCTFDGNESADTTSGHIFIDELAANLSVVVRRSIFTGSASVLPVNTGCDADSIVNCDSYGNRKDWFTGNAAVSDTLHVDPNYNSTAYIKSGYYQARHLPLIIRAEGYWGWERYYDPDPTSNVRHDSHFRRRGH